MDLNELCRNFGYNYTKTLSHVMQTLCDNNLSKDCTSAKKQIREIIKNKTPYSYYAPDPIEISYETLKRLVLGSDREKSSEPSKGYNALMYLSYDEVHSFLVPYLADLKRRIHGLSRKRHAFTDVKMAVTYYEASVKLRQNSIVLFEREKCTCDICGVTAKYVTLDQNADGLSKFSIWAIDKNNKPVRMTVDHKQARGLGGNSSFRNLVPMCESCNSIKSVIESRIANHNNDIEKLNNAKIYPFECSFYW